jgi:DNA-binding transcriptional LysR family regulator
MTADHAIDLKRLRYFVAVCKHGGFSHAAGVIGVAQPALTRQVQLLERQVGLKLITRNGRGVQPTEEGRFLFARSSEHLDRLDELLLELKQRTSKISGQAVVGICPTLSRLFLDDLKSSIAEQSPELSMAVVEAYSSDLKHLVNSDRLDIALTYKSNGDAIGRHVELFPERLVLVSGFQPHGRQRRYRLNEIESLKLILPSKIHELRIIIDTVAKTRGVLLRPDIEFDSLDAAKILLKSPLRYFSILPFFSVIEEVERKALSLYAIDDPDMSRMISVATPVKPRDHAMTTYLQRHIEGRASLIRAHRATMFGPSSGF